MGCTKCGTDLSSLHLIVKDIIRQLIDEGKLQEIIEYELLRGLQLNSQTCNVSS